MSKENKEKSILLISFIAGLTFAVAEFIFAIYSNSQSSLMDAVYDACELVFIAFILFLTPLFHKPISEKRPFGFFQIESIFLIIKGVMMISVTISVSMSIISSALKGGNIVDAGQVSLFQLLLGVVSIFVFIPMYRLNKSITSPTIDGELLGWRLDIAYSLGMSFAFFAASFLNKTPFAPITPYFDQIIAVLIAAFMLPETVKMLFTSIKNVFLFAPDEETILNIKAICENYLKENKFNSNFYDITRTGRKLWVSIYFTIDEEYIYTERLQAVGDILNSALSEQYDNCVCELILTARP